MGSGKVHFAVLVIVMGTTPSMQVEELVSINQHQLSLL